MAFSLGIEVGKTNLELALRSDEDIVARTTVPNDPEGHNILVDWLFEQGASPTETYVCMEAGGDFEKAVARRLYQEDYRVSVVNPRRIKGYASSQLKRTKADAADAALIARFVGRTLGPGNRPQRRRVGFRRLREPARPSGKRRPVLSGPLDEAEDEAVRRAHENLLDEIERGNLDCQD